MQGLDKIAKKQPEALEQAEMQWLKDGTGVYSTSIIGQWWTGILTGADLADYMFKLRPSVEDLASMGPA